jgi:hypothetical protein
MTAVEWLAKELLREHPIQTNSDVIQQAKEMEEQQIKTAYGSGIETMRKSFSMSSHIPKGAQEYYNDTFNK